MQVATCLRFALGYGKELASIEAAPSCIHFVKQFQGHRFIFAGNTWKKYK